MSTATPTTKATSPKPATSATPPYDAIVIGSGFGGSVMTLRLAAAGRRVLLLERGRRYPPGSFPRSPYRMGRALWDPSEGLYGMFSVWSFDRLGAIVGSGLGGGSLIYANVLLRKDPEWFVQEDGDGEVVERWPISRDDLEPHYDDAEPMLGAQRYPFDSEPYASTPRTRAFHDAATRLGWQPFLPPLAVTFAADGRPPAIGEPIPEAAGRENLHGMARSTCRLCGECDIGCNYGAKNTLDFNYLSQAARAGAEIRDRCEVREIEHREGGGYAVRYVEHDLDLEGIPHDTESLPLHEVVATRVVLSAGSLGSTWLLLRNHRRLGGSWPALGTRFSGNGDLLTLAVKPRDSSGRPIRVEGGVGPSITVAARFPGDPDPGAPPGTPGRGYYIEDAGYPDLLSWVVHSASLPLWLMRQLHTIKRLAMRALGRGSDADMSAELSRLLGDAELSAGLLPLLGMGREVPGGSLGLRKGRLHTTWSPEASRAYFDAVRAHQAELAVELGARHQDNPVWHLGRRVITVHPLGGAPMGRSRAEGVVDPMGRVFGHPGLYVADGSVMPGTVGPNPSLTIAAVAERFAQGILDEPRDTPAPATEVFA
jgi:cholesterol oxidase